MDTDQTNCGWLFLGVLSGTFSEMLASIRDQLPTETRMFYLTLPNNRSMSYYPENNATHFFTKPPQSFDLTRDYEVGLPEILVSTTYFNVEDKRILESLSL